MGEGRRIPQAKGRKLTKAVDPRRIDRAIRDHAILGAADAAFAPLRSAVLERLALHREHGPIIDDNTTPAQVKAAARGLSRVFAGVMRALGRFGPIMRDEFDD